MRSSEVVTEYYIEDRYPFMISSQLRDCVAIIGCFLKWIPAFAGMTKLRCHSRESGNL